MIELFRPLLRGFGQLIFMPHCGAGVMVLLAILVNSPLMFLAAIVGGLGGTLVGRWVMVKSAFQDGLAGFNGVLLGLAAVIFLQSSALLWLVIFIGAGVGAYCFNWGLMRNWPLLTAPYICVMLLMWWQLPTLVQPDGGIGLNFADHTVVSALLAGIGQMGFQGNVLSAAIIMLGLLWGGSWRALGWASIGSACGTLLGLAGATEQHLMIAGFAGYNSALIAVALGVVSGHRIKSWQPWLGMLVAGLLALWGFQLSIIPVLTIPFVLAMWIVMLVETLKRRRRGEF
ncbi:MAG: urea transporter [Pseudomonadales bacterium]